MNTAPKTWQEATERVMEDRRQRDRDFADRHMPGYTRDDFRHLLYMNPDDLQSTIEEDNPAMSESQANARSKSMKLVAQFILRDRFGETHNLYEDDRHIDANW